MPDLIGRFLKGRYRVDELVGQGGMAEVYKAWDTQRTANMALKLLRSDLAQDATFWEHFVAEARTLESLQHPNIVRYYGLEQDGPLYFIVMDYIDGTSLRAEITRKRATGLSPQRVLEIMRPVCSALHYAHQKGLVHCDVKPGNILISSTAQVYLADFGIAWMMGSGFHTAGPSGTATHMAPEQIRGERPTPQTDVYGLGVVLFEMLTGGELPFNGEQAAISGELRERVYWEQLNLAPPSVRRNHPHISQGFEAILQRCLQKDPRNRYHSVLELMNVINHEVANAAGVARPRPERKPDQRAATRPDAEQAVQPSPGVRERTPLRKIPGWLLVVLVSIVAIVMVIALGADTDLDGDTPRLPATQKPAATIAVPKTYAVNQCMEVIISMQAGTGKTIECVTSVTILPNGNMQVMFSWTALTGGVFKIVKPPDTGNTNLYLTDDLGNRYDHSQSGGAANLQVEIYDGQTVEGWFLFPAPSAGAQYFIFHDDDNLVSTAPFHRDWP